MPTLRSNDFPYAFRVKLTPNHALNRTARKLRLRVPSSLRSSAAG